MERLKMAICIGKEGYGQKLAEYISQSVKEEVEVCFYGRDIKHNVERSAEAREQLEDIDLLLIEKDWPEQESWKEKAKKVYDLVYDMEVGEGVDNIYAYQAACDIYKKLFWGSERKRIANAHLSKMVMIYNPYRHKAPMAKIGEIYEINKMLWLSIIEQVPSSNHEIRDKSKTDRLLLGEKERSNSCEQCKRDIIDVMYLCRNKDPRIQDKLVGVVERKEISYYEQNNIASNRMIREVHHIQTAYHPSQLYEGNREDYEKLLDTLQKESGYDWLMVEVGFLFPGCISYFEKADQIVLVGTKGREQEENGQMMRYLEAVNSSYERLEEKEGGEHGTFKSITGRITTIDIGTDRYGTEDDG